MSLPQGERQSPAGSSLSGKGPLSPMAAGSASPSLEKIFRDFEGQLKAIEEARRYLEDRVSPFQRHLEKQHQNVEQALKQLETRARPLRQYLEEQEKNLSRVSQHVSTELRDQFEVFGKHLAEQRSILENAARYLDDQPRPLQRFSDDQQRVIELIYKEIEEKLEPFGRFLKEQQRLLGSIATPQILEEFETLAGFMQDRERALERYALSPEHRPAELFAELDETYNKYKTARTGTFPLLGKVMEQCRLADTRLREALHPVPRELVEARPAEEPRPQV